MHEHPAFEERSSSTEPLQITDVQIRLHERSDERTALKAFATITLNRMFVVHDLKVIEKPDRLFVSMPATRKRDGKYKDIAHPIRKEFREYLEDVVIQAYEDELRERHGD
jgi:stage V sporulation protein G